MTADPGGRLMKLLLLMKSCVLYCKRHSIMLYFYESRVSIFFIITVVAFAENVVF